MEVKLNDFPQNDELMIESIDRNSSFNEDDADALDDNQNYEMIDAGDINGLDGADD